VKCYEWLIGRDLEGGSHGLFQNTVWRIHRAHPTDFTWSANCPAPRNIFPCGSEHVTAKFIWRSRQKTRPSVSSPCNACILSGRSAQIPDSGLSRGLPRLTDPGRFAASASCARVSPKLPICFVGRRSAESRALWDCPGARWLCADHRLTCNSALTVRYLLRSAQCWSFVTRAEPRAHVYCVAVWLSLANVILFSLLHLK
jgi:hypothetical protein